MENEALKTEVKDLKVQTRSNQELQLEVPAQMSLVRADNERLKEQFVDLKAEIIRLNSVNKEKVFKLTTCFPEFKKKTFIF